MLIKKPILLLVLLLTATTGFSQVVTPSLDPALPVELASAVSWRIGSVVGVQTQAARETVKSGSTDYEPVGSAALFAYQPSNIVTELYSSPNERHLFWDASADTLSETTWVDGRFKLALRGENRVSVGIGYNINDQKTSTTTTHINSYEGGFSIRMLDGVYIAGGLQRVTERFEIGDSRKWNRLLAGLAFQFGNPLGTIFRAEGSYHLSPASRIDNPAIPDRFATHEVQAATELFVNDILVSYQYRHTRQVEVNSAGDDRTSAYHRFGFGFRFGRLICGLYGHQERTIEGDRHLDRYAYQGTLSLGFL
jgi:hypothetical protein